LNYSDGAEYFFLFIVTFIFLSTGSALMALLEYLLNHISVEFLILTLDNDSTDLILYFHKLRYRFLCFQVDFFGKGFQPEGGLNYHWPEMIFFFIFPKFGHNML
jgi:hypothetical protein